MNELDKLIDLYTLELVNVYANIETELIYKVARLWADYEEIGGNLEYLIERLDTLNVINEDTLELIATMTGEPLFKIKTKLREIGYSTPDYETYTKAYKTGLIAIDPNTIKINPIIERHVKQLDKEIMRIQTKTKLGLYKDTHRRIKQAQLEVELGIKDSNQAIFDAVEDMAKNGITSDSYLRNGQEVHQGMEGVVRRAVRTSFIETSNDISEKVGNDLGLEHWYVTQHLGARAKGDGYVNHAQWQGKVYTDDELVSVCGEGEITGFSGINCRHRKYGVIKGVSFIPETYDMDELERIYTLEQRQRLLERNVRTTKRQLNALSVFDSEESIERSKVLRKTLKRQQKSVADHVANNSEVLRRDYSREKVMDVT